MHVGNVMSSNLLRADCGYSLPNLRSSQNKKMNDQPLELDAFLDEKYMLYNSFDEHRNEVGNRSNINGAGQLAEKIEMRAIMSTIEG